MIKPTVFGALLAATIAACGGKANPDVTVPAPPTTANVPDVPATKPPEVPPMPKLTAAESFTKDCMGELAAAKDALPALVAPPPGGARTVDNTLVPYNLLLTHLGNAGAMAGLMSEVHPDEATRDAARACEQEVSKFGSELSLNRDLYDALVKVSTTGADADTERFLAITLRDYRRAGVDRDDKTRDRLKAIDEELTKLGQDFSKNIAEDVRSISLASAAQLDGLPQDFIDAHKPGADGAIKITTDYPDYNPFMTYAKDDKLRHDLYVAFRSRGDRDNERLFQQILTLRAERAHMLGYANWADYITEDKMIKSGKNAGDFIEKVWKLAWPRAKRDNTELLHALQKSDKGAKIVQDWQRFYLENQVRIEKYQVDSSLVRTYFSFDKVLPGLLDITSTIYGIQYVPAADAPVWHEDVKAFDVMKDGQKIGRIFLDLHPRDGKYKHAAQFTWRDGVTGVQLPEGALVCNFPNPRTSSGPALMEHEDVVTMFHEFGHLMHHILGGGHRWIKQSGVSTEWDFVEAPSQMFEEWAWSYETLSKFATNDKGETIPKDLVEKMRRADKFGIGTQTVQQMFYAMLSLDLHQQDPAKLNQLDEVKKLQKKYTLFPYVDGTHFHTSFGHLVGYSAMYYTYMWSLVIAKDMLTPFAKTGLMDLAITKKYRDTVLAPGGSKDAAVLVHDFLGRDYSFAAFEHYLSE